VYFLKMVVRCRSLWADQTFSLEKGFCSTAAVFSCATVAADSLPPALAISPTSIKRRQHGQHPRHGNGSRLLRKHCCWCGRRRQRSNLQRLQASSARLCCHRALDQAGREEDLRKRREEESYGTAFIRGREKSISLKFSIVGQWHRHRFDRGNKR
jgi:hypothetical protein